MASGRHIATHAGPVTYVASPTLAKFHADSNFVRAVMGPIGSGKSVACCWEAMRRASEQVPNREGVRHTRGAIIRNSYRELTDTTMRTFFDWFPEQAGHFRQMDMMWTLDQPLPDGTRMRTEVMFRALDKPQDVKKLLSLELTWAWINEAREVPKQVLDMLLGRVGRFPSKRDGIGATWYGVIMDTNPPDSDHWFYNIFEEERPKGWKLFKQPSGVSPEAENLKNLPENYYQNMMAGKDQEWINVYVHGRYGFISDGKPVYPEYRDEIHSTLDDLLILTKVYVGIDFGLTPAAVFVQFTPSGQCQVIDELVTSDLGAKAFAQLLKDKLNREYRGVEIELYADPAGEQRAQTDEQTPFMFLWAAGIEAVPAPTNDFTMRRESVVRYLSRLTVTGHPAFLVGPKAPLTRKAMAGGYKYKRIQVSGEARYRDVPDKAGRYSHPADALQYAVLGADGISEIVGMKNTDFDQAPYDRMYL